MDKLKDLPYMWQMLIRALSGTDVCRDFPDLLPAMHDLFDELADKREQLRWRVCRSEQPDHDHDNDEPVNTACICGTPIEDCVGWYDKENKQWHNADGYVFHPDFWLPISEPVNDKRP